MKIRSVFLIVFAGIFFLNSCTKDKVYTNPYEGGKESLGVYFDLAVAPDPAVGTEGTIVDFSVTGLLPYKDSLNFFFNGQPAEIIAVTDNSLKVKIPEFASSGITLLKVQDQLFVGPHFSVEGKISIDPEFTLKGGANNSINDFLILPDGRFIFVGNFTNYDNKGVVSPIRHIARAYNTGAMDGTFNTEGSNGSINSILGIGSNYFVGGNFSTFYYNNGKSNISSINNLTRLGENGAVDSIKVETYSTKFTGLLKAVPAFNGGTDASIRKIFNYQDKIIAIGDFKYFLSHSYDLSTVPVIVGDTTIIRDSITTDSIRMPQVARFKLDGSLDKTFHFNNSTQTGLDAGNGVISDGYLQDDGKLILVGNFTKFDGASTNRIVRLNTDGSIDKTFNTGTGADKAINSITYNASTRKYLLTGQFNSFNGTASKRLVMLNSDGSIDNSFSSKDFGNGYPTYAIQISDGKIVVSGVFDSYNQINRPNFMILDNKGSLAKGYNSSGELNGSVKKIYESISSQGKLTLLLIGNFTEFDGQAVSNITRIVLDK